MLIIEILTVLVLIVLNGAFAMSEMAIVSSRRARLNQMAEEGGAGARTALQLIDEPSRFLSTVQIGITLIGIVAGAFGGATVATRLGLWLREYVGARADVIAMTIVVAAITYLSLIVGELVPKRIALRNPERVATLLSGPMSLLSRLAAPLVMLLGASTDAALRLLGLQGARDATVTEEEVKSMITEGTQAGVFAPQEKRMIEGVLRLADRTVRTVMSPRPDVVWLDVGDPLEAIRTEVRASPYSRFPLCRGDLDEVIGVVRAADVLDVAREPEGRDLARVAAKPLVVHDGTSVMRLLDLLRKSGQQMAIVVDEYGSVEGIVTLTDVLEVIAGSLPDLDTSSEAMIIPREDGSWLIDGATPVDDVEDAIGIRGMGEDGDFHTLAGFVLHGLGHVPTAGESFLWGGHRFEVVDMDGRRIDKVLVTPPTSPAES